MTRKPIGLAYPHRPQAVTFNDVEKQSAVKQEILRNPSKEAKLFAEVAVLTEMVKVLSARVRELEKP
jgi:predicted nucleic-acid-binding protein